MVGTGLSMGTCLSAHANSDDVIAPMSFASPELEARFIALSAELRCPKCENQSLRDSNAMVAADLRARLHELLHAGYSDQQIREHMRERYGDYVLYRPRLADIGWLLWLTPILLALACVWAWRGFKRRISVSAVVARAKTAQNSTGTSSQVMDVDSAQAASAHRQLRIAVVAVLCAALLLVGMQIDWHAWWVYQQIRQAMMSQDSTRIYELLHEYLRGS